MSENQVKHIAFIMDGNGRWATARGLKRLDGHKEGAKTVERLMKAAPDLGIETVTFYAFSSENWKRPVDEVSGLMELLKIYFSSKIKDLVKSNVRLRVFGDKSEGGMLSKEVCEVIAKAEEQTAHCTGLNVNFCINYGGRNEIVRATKFIAEKVKNGEMMLEDITEDVFSNSLDSRGQIEPDLVLRTGGDNRVSNFLLWQLAYAEFAFVDKAWPDFTGDDLAEIIQKQKNIERRFGGLK